MSLTQREAFARLMEHMCRHDGDGGHGYSQVNRMGDGTVEWVDLGDGVRVSVAGGDRDCSSGIVTCLRAVGIDTHGASYTGNMREELLKSGAFVWHPMGDGYVARRGDIYLNEGHHTAMCTSADPDMLAQFSRSETGGIRGRTGDQDGYESIIRGYYSYPWDGKLAWATDGGAIGGDVSDVADATDPVLGDTRYWGPKFSRAMQAQRGTPVDGVVSGQASEQRPYLWAIDASTIEYGGGGSPLVESLQALWGSVQDGYLGPETVADEQRWLGSMGIECGGVDGYQGTKTNVGLAEAITGGLLRA